MFKYFMELELWKKILFIVLLIFIVALIIILIPKYTGPEKNCIFLNEKANLHEEYYVTLLDFSDCESIFILKNEGDFEQTELISTYKHFISVTLLIEHINVANEKESHLLDVDDFKLKDHTGVQLKNFNFFSKENGLALENKNFSTVESQKDYKWLNTRIETGTKQTITLYFEVPEEISSIDTTMVVEIDFFDGISNGHQGTDIVLAQRK